jgi:hypothetical protein
MTRKSFLATLFAPLLAKFAPKARVLPRSGVQIARESKPLICEDPDCPICHIDRRCPDCGRGATIRMFTAVNSWLCGDCYRKSHEITDCEAVGVIKEMTLAEFRRRYPSTKSPDDSRGNLA